VPLSAELLCFGC